jgi:Fe-S cluster biogenesis protein NfuA
VSDTPPTAVSGPELSSEETSRRTDALHEVMAVVKQAVQADGGDVELVATDFTAGVVQVRLSGACGSCAVAGSTLEDGIERVLRQRLDWVREVRGDVVESDVVGSGGWRALL